MFCFLWDFFLSGADILKQSSRTGSSSTHPLLYYQLAEFVSKTELAAGLLFSIKMQMALNQTGLLKN